MVARPCAYPGCSELVKKGYCDKHQRIIDHDRAKANVAKAAIHRLYDRRWGKRRVAQLSQQPWCEECIKHGQYTPATDVHHVERHRGDRRLFDASALISLCHQCHSRITISQVHKEHKGKKSLIERGR